VNIYVLLAINMLFISLHFFLIIMMVLSLLSNRSMFYASVFSIAIDSVLLQCDTKGGGDWGCKLNIIVMLSVQKLCFLNKAP